jgi:hypothetical protein
MRVTCHQNTRTFRAVVVDPTAAGKLAIKPIELRDPDRDEGSGGTPTAAC